MRKAYILLLMLILLSGCNKLESIEAPEFLKTEEKVGKNLLINGVGYPEAMTKIYLNRELIGTTQVDDQGKFSYLVEFSTEGGNTIQAQQTFDGVTSEFSPEKRVIVDITPPSPENFELTSEIPEITTEGQLLLTGTTEPNVIVSTGKTESVANEEGLFEVDVKLREGNNNFSIYLSDEIGNKTTVLENVSVTLDTKKPLFSKSSFNCSQESSLTQEQVCLSYGSFHSYSSTYQVPFTGKVLGNIESVKFGKHYLKWNEVGMINQVIPLWMRIGTNNFDVEIIDKAGNKTLDIYSIEVVYDSPSYDDSDYSDLESQIYDLEDRIDDLEYEGW